MKTYILRLTRKDVNSLTNIIVTYLAGVEEELESALSGGDTEEARIQGEFKLTAEELLDSVLQQSED